MLRARLVHNIHHNYSIVSSTVLDRCSEKWRHWAGYMKSIGPRGLRLAHNSVSGHGPRDRHAGQRWQLRSGHQRAVAPDAGGVHGNDRGGRDLRCLAHGGWNWLR